MSPDAGEHPQHRRSLWLAAALTALAVPVLFLLAIYLLAVVDSRSLAPDGEVHSRAAGAIIFAGLPISAIGMYVIGMPMILLLRRLRWLAVLPVTLAAAIAGAVCFTALTFFFSRTWPDLEGLLFGVCVGIGAGLVYSWLAGLRWSFGRVAPPC